VGKLSLHGWKGFDTTVPLWPVTFLVGPNGSGKSSLLEALAVISHLARRGSLREDLRPWLRGWPDGVFSREAGVGCTEASLTVSWRRSRYVLGLRNAAQPEITNEMLEVGNRTYIQTKVVGGKPVRRFYGEGAGAPLQAESPFESALGLIARSPQRRRHAQTMIDLMTSIETYALDADFLRGTAVDTRPIPYSRKGTGIVAGLIDAKRNGAVWDAVLASLRAVQPDLDSIETFERPRGVVLKYLDGRTTQIDEESDGLVRAAGMFLARYREGCPAILGFDEAENGFHMSRLVEVVSRLAPARQEGPPSPEMVVLSTHSPDLVYKAARTLGGRVGVLSLWRSRSGRVASPSPAPSGGCACRSGSRSLVTPLPRRAVTRGSAPGSGEGDRSGSCTRSGFESEVEPRGSSGLRGLPRRLDGGWSRLNVACFSAAAERAHEDPRHERADAGRRRFPAAGDVQHLDRVIAEEAPEPARGVRDRRAREIDVKHGLVELRGGPHGQR
jgi:predicted ATPase